MEVAEKTQRMKDDTHIASQSGNETIFLPGSYVLVSYPGRGPPHKLLPHWAGPMQVLSSDCNHYSLRNLATGKLEKHHVMRLKPFHYDPDETKPEQVALRDRNMFLVEEVLAHKGSTKRKNSLLFKVKWIGYPVEEATWEPWTSLRDNLVLHRYLRDKELSHLIPKEHMSLV